MKLLNKLPNWITGAIAVLLKDLRLEWRNKSVLGSLMIFVLSTLTIFLFATGREDLGPRVQSALLWIIILFTAALGLGRTFLTEEERGTGIFLRMHTHGAMVYLGKLCFGFLTILFANTIATILFVLFSNISIVLPGLFILTVFLGTIGLVGATTLLSAIISQNRRSGPLLPMLVFPLLIPFLLSAVEVTYFSLAGQPFAGNAWSAAHGSLIVMVSFSGVVIAVSILLFDYVWNE